MAEEKNGDGYGGNFERRLDRMNATIQALTDSMLLQHRLAEQRHALVMEEIHGLIDAAREHRIDILALFELNKRTRERLDALEQGDKPTG